MLWALPIVSHVRLLFLLAPLLTLLHLALALPIKVPRGSIQQTAPASSNLRTTINTSKDIEILDFNFDTGWTQFAARLRVAAPAPDGERERERELELTTPPRPCPLVFELNINPVSDLLESSITLNSQLLSIQWNRTAETPAAFYATLAAPSTHVLAIEDKRGNSHSVAIAFTGFIAHTSQAHQFPEPAGTQHINLHILSVDHLTVKHFELHIVAQPNSKTNRLKKLFRTSDMHSAKLDGQLTHLITSDTLLDATPFEQYRHAGHGHLDIEAELESLLLLEAEAGDLNAKIAAKKKAIATCLKDHRDQATLRHLLRECDGVVCAAKVIAQSICDKMGILTEPEFQYTQMQHSQAQRLMQFDEESNRITQAGNVAGKFHTGPEKHNIASPSGDRYFALHTNGAAVNVVYPQNLLFRVLSIIAGVFGLSALFSLVRKKCMSARSKVDRLAAQEERRNARAYRKAARRAEMRRRWQVLMSAISCFGANQEPPRVEDYEEKRALILQDAFLEQELEVAEKGEVMEAEIRELRNAHEIVSGLVGIDEHRYDLRMAVRAPPPALVPLPYDMTGRSRASTGTLPSYTSECLPDYRSRISVEAPSSSSSINGGSTIYSSTTSSADDVLTSTAAGSTPRSSIPCAESTGTRGTRVSQLSTSSHLPRCTPTSSVLDVSPRGSEDSLRTSYWRRSL